MEFSEALPVCSFFPFCFLLVFADLCVFFVSIFVIFALKNYNIYCLELIVELLCNMMKNKEKEKKMLGLL